MGNTMKHFRYLLMAALVAMPLMACDEDTNPVAIQYGTVTGTVAAEGTGLSGVSVTLVGATSQSATTAAGGTYTFTNVEAGSYGVAIDASTHTDVSFSQTSKATTITSDGETVTVDFSGSYIRTATISGVVTASGTPLGGVAISVTGGPDAVVNNSVTNAGGEYFATGLRAGTYTVSFTAPAGVDFATTSAAVTVATGEAKTAHFPGNAVQMATISGAVTVDGVGIVGITVALSGAAVATTETVAGGAYTFVNLVPGSYVVTVTAPADVDFGAGLGVNPTKPLDVAAGQTGVASFAGLGPKVPATISIQSIMKGGVPVNLSNVSGQIEVSVNVTRNDQTLHYVDVLIDDVVVATQVFPQPVASDVEMQESELLVLNVPTTQVEPGTYGWVPAVYNGGREVSAILYVTELGADPIPANKVPIILQNRDATIPGFEFGGDLDFSPDEPARTALGDETTPEDWFAGAATFTGPQYISYSMVVPDAVFFYVQAGYCDDQPGDIVASFMPADPTTATDGLTIINQYECTAELADVMPDWMNPVIDWPANPVGPDGTAAMQPDGMSALGAEFALSHPDPLNDRHITPRRFVIMPEDVQSGQISDPDELNLDNLGPAVYMRQIAFDPEWDEEWINADFDLVKGVFIDEDDDDDYLDDDPIYLEDEGVGPSDDELDEPLGDTREARMPVTWDDDEEEWLCGETAVTNADLAVTNTSSEVDGHRVCGFGKDKLDNDGRAMFWDVDEFDELILPNWFGKDVVPGHAEISLEARGAFPAGWVEPPITWTDSTNLNEVANLFDMLAPYATGAAIPGWGIDYYDDRAGVHQNFTGTGVGPVVQTLTRYYPENGTADTEDDEYTGTAWLGVPLGVPGETWARSSDIGAGAGVAAVEVDWDPTAIGTLTGLWFFEAWVTDMAGNVTHIIHNFGVDQTTGPTLNSITLSSPYFPGTFGSFNFWGGDDWEVDELQVAMTYLTTDGNLSLKYPATTADADISPWDMDYPFDELEPFGYPAGFGVLGTNTTPTGIIGRIDVTDVDGDLDGIVNVDGADVDALAEDEDMLPFNMSGVILTDILGNGPSLAFGPVPFVLPEFGGWGASTPDPWTGEDILTWTLIDTGILSAFADLVAEHKASNSITAPFFEAVLLIHQTAGGVMTVCGEMDEVLYTDEGLNRYYRYYLSVTSGIPAVCSTAGTLRAGGVASDALLLTDVGVSVPVIVPAP
jgi:hypothetical protein